MTQVKEALRQYMDDSGKTCDEVADDLGIGRTSLFNKMRGQYEFTLRESYELSRMLGVTMDEFYEMTRAQSARA